MKERPILFSGPMVTAIRESRKTQTRRIVKPQPAFAYPGTTRIVFAEHPFSNRALAGTPAEGMGCDGMAWIAEDWCGNIVGAEEADWLNSPYGLPGDRLWIREMFNLFDEDGMEWPTGQGLPKALPDGWHVTYAEECTPEAREVFRFRPSIHMPRWASRASIEIISVRVERIREITGQDVLAEGVEFPDAEHYLKATHRWAPWIKVWDSINGEGSWEKNPWVWVVEFKRIQP